MFTLTSQVFGILKNFDVSQAECSVEKVVKLKSSFRFFQDQHSVTFVDLSDDPILNCFACTGEEIFAPVQFYTKLSDVKFGPKTTPSSVTSLPTTQGFYLKGTREILLKSLLPRISAHNPKTKVIINVIDQKTPSESKDIVKIAYEKYKMFNVAIVVRNSQKQRGSPGSLCVYNPFNAMEPTSCVTFNFQNLMAQLDEFDELYNGRITNLGQYPLRISMFSFPMYARPIFDSHMNRTKYIYMNGCALEIIAEKMNFYPAYLNASYDDSFTSPKTTLIGNLALIELDVADYAANARLIINYKTDKVLFMQAMDMVKYVFVIKKLERTRKLIMFSIELYDTQCAVIATALTIMFPVFFTFLEYFSSKDKNAKECVFLKSCLHVIALLNNVSIRRSEATSVKFLTNTVVFYALIATALIQGTIVQRLNRIEGTAVIDSNEKLIDHGYEFVIASSLTNAMREQGGDRLRDKLRRTAEKHNGAKILEGITMVLANDKMAFLMNKAFCGNYLNQFYDPETGENLLEVIPETAFEFYVASMAPKASPFVDKMNEITLRITESGMYQFYFNQAVKDNDAFWYQRLKSGLTPKAPNLSLKLKELWPAFKLFLLLTLLSIFFFSLELTFMRLRRFIMRLSRSFLC